MVSSENFANDYLKTSHLIVIGNEHCAGKKPVLLSSDLIQG
jgi:carbonic anhydrase